MFFERFLSCRALGLTAKTFGVSFFWTAFFLFSLVFESGATAQTTADFRSPSARSASAVSRGIPARVESNAFSGTTRARTEAKNVFGETVSATNGVRRVAREPDDGTIRRAAARGGSNGVAKKSATAVPGRVGVEERTNVASERSGAGAVNVDVETSTYRQTFDAPTSLPSVGFQLQIKRFATLEEAEREPTPSDGYLAILPRENFLKENPEDPQNLTKAARGGIDARVKPNDVESGTNGANGNVVASTSVRENAPNETGVATANGEVVVFTLSGLQPDEARLLRDAEDGRWNEIDLFGAALIAEGLTTEKRRAPYRAKFERLVAELSAATAFERDQLSKTEAIYNFLHQNVLTAQYNLNCSSLVAALDTGVFNCVSATTLFNCFAERSGLRVAALETTGHAKSRVKFADSFLDLETTCSSWARLPDKLRPYSRSVAVARPIQTSAGIDATIAESSSFEKTRITNETAFADGSQTIVRGADGGGWSVANSGLDAAPDSARSGANANLNGNSAFGLDGADYVAEIGSTTFDPRTFEAEGAAPIGYSHTKNRRPMREIGEVELVATIYYNVGVDFYQNERYEEAIAAYIKAARLAPNNLTILGNLKATLNNWAIQIAMKEKNFERAIQITEQGMILDPNFEEYKMNLPIFFQHWTTYLAKDNRWDEVARVEREYRKRFPKPTPR